MPVSDHQPVVAFGRAICGNLETAVAREWLVTNGLGGYASGTVSDVLTRRYHGLLVAALDPPLGRTLLLTKLETTATYGGRTYELFANRWVGQPVSPTGFRYIQHFRLEGTTPVWTYALADALLEKRIWMQAGANTTYVLYSYRRGSLPLALNVRALVNYRNHGDTVRTRPPMEVAPTKDGLRVQAFDGATPFYILSSTAEARSEHTWYADFFLGVEAYRGLDAIDQNLCAGAFDMVLRPSQSLTLVASTDPAPGLHGHDRYTLRQEYEQELLQQSAGLTHRVASPEAPAWVQHLVLAADQFVVRRRLPDGDQGDSIIAGYHWFADWGRDTMISLPGLTLATGRPEVARRILLTFAEFIDAGMLPNRFPERGETAEYNTVDATLWYFEAVRAYYAATGDVELLRELLPVLTSIIEWHRAGTRYDIRLDPHDGLLHAGGPGVQLTWMDAKIDDWVVTPRRGKPIEVNALWYNALRIMEDVTNLLGLSDDAYTVSARQAERGFERYWNDATGYCYDVLDGPDGDDATLRPNQLLAVSLPHSALQPDQQRGVVGACQRHLLTSFGLRSLAPDDPAYVGHYGGDRRQRDASYHQGTVWAWLIGPFVRAHLRVHDDITLAQSYLAAFAEHLADRGLGTISEIFDGDAPHTPRGAIAQAWSVAEVLRAWKLTQVVGRATVPARRVR